MRENCKNWHFDHSTIFVKKFFRIATLFNRRHGRKNGRMEFLVNEVRLRANTRQCTQFRQNISKVNIYRTQTYMKGDQILN